MDVSKNRGTPKWMVKIMEIPIKMDDLGGKPPYFWKYPHHVADLMASRKVTREPLNDKSMKELEDAGRSASMAITRFHEKSSGKKFGCVGKKRSDFSREMILNFRCSISIYTIYTNIYIYTYIYIHIQV